MEEVALVEAGKSLLTVQEHTVTGYPARTAVNARDADLTIAFALNFGTPGEKLTKKYAGTRWYGVYISAMSKAPGLLQTPEYIVHEINAHGAETLNIAGNGLHTLMKHGISQENCDTIVLTTIGRIVNNPELQTKIKLIRSGGQTGFDEAGVKAAQELGIPALALLPKNFLYRDAAGVDHTATLDETIKRLTPKS